MDDLPVTCFTTITQETIKGYIRKAEKFVVYAKPAFYEEEMKILLEAAEKGVRCDIYFDKGDLSVRRGFGDANALRKIREQEELPETFYYHLKDRIRLAFLIVDDVVIIFAPNIKAFENENADLKFPNGIVCQGELAKEVVRLFVPELENREEPTKTVVIKFGASDGDAAGENKAEQIQATVTVNQPEDPEEQQKALEEAVTALALKPAIEPDKLQETLIYTDNYQIMRVITNGIQIANKSISLKPFYDSIGVSPKNAKYTWQVMTQEEKEKLESTKRLQNDIARIKKEYKEKGKLFDAGKYGTIIDIAAAREFTDKLEKARENFIQSYTSNNSSETNELLAVLENSAAKLQFELIRYCSDHFAEFKEALEEGYP